MALTQSRKVKVHTLGRRIGGQSRDGIWLLDDDVSMLKALGRLMNSAGLIVEKFNDPATFLAKLQHAPCRVAVLDIWVLRERRQLPHRVRSGALPDRTARNLSARTH